MKRTKIVCTLGPASEDLATIEALIKAGCNAVRLNMSHGDYAWHSVAIKRIRAAEKRRAEPIAIITDLQGPKARLGEIRNSKFEIRNGERVIFTSGSAGGNKIPVAVPNFHKYAKRGAHLLIADGTIECVVERVVGRDIHARVILGGELKSRNGIAIAGASLPLPSLTAKDKKDIAWAKKQNIDFVALSFVKKAEDVRVLRCLLDPLPRTGRPSAWQWATVQIIVKIETREAVRNFDKILREADGIMLARGDLALATSPEEVPIIQKEIIEKCRRAAKPVIVATEMLASMEHNPRPTRAEASDVANAVIDHADAAMLSGETAMGQYPVKTVSTMAHIIKKTEGSRFDDLQISVGRGLVPRHGRVQDPTLQEQDIALTSSLLARRDKAKAIVAGSLTGHIGRLLSCFRTEVFLFVGSPHPRVVRQLNLSWGVRPFLVPKMKNMDALLKYLLAHARKSGLKKGDRVVFVGSKKLAPHASDFVGVQGIDKLSKM